MADSIQSQNSQHQHPVSTSSSTISDNVISMPHKKQKTLSTTEQNYLLGTLPNAEHYERSFMHREIISHIIVTSTQFIISASFDGHIKFWKKMQLGIEFVRNFKAHNGEITCLSASNDGVWLASISSEDQTIKIFDVISFDMVNQIQTEFKPVFCCWIYSNTANMSLLAVSFQENSNISLYRVDGQSVLDNIASLHEFPVRLMAFNSIFNTVISIDQHNIIEYWDPIKYQTPQCVTFQMKSETSLYFYLSKNIAPLSITISHNGLLFVIFSSDFHVRLFRFLSGKMIKSFNENISIFSSLVKNPSSLYYCDNLKFGRRSVIEKEFQKQIENSSYDLSPTICFDDSDRYLIYATLMGIKVVNWADNICVRLLGKEEYNTRFIKIALFQGVGLESTSLSQAHLLKSSIITESSTASYIPDPTIYVTAFKQNRFYCFSSRDPDMDVIRDIQNEKFITTTQKEKESNRILGESAVLQTTKGDIHIELFPRECPKSVENFCTHSRNNYYNNCLFHRVIKGFMIQTGDPLGNGTGGESIWGHDFEDEFSILHTHNRPFMVSMANAGPNTNSSQFFITTVPCPWLDNKHTVFGRVKGGNDVVLSIENVLTTLHSEKIKIINHLTLYSFSHFLFSLLISTLG